MKTFTKKETIDILKLIFVCGILPLSVAYYLNHLTTQQKQGLDATLLILFTITGLIIFGVAFVVGKSLIRKSKVQ